MLALFCGTASLPHILIRYYTVKDEAAARKSTIVGIACIGFFYVLTLYMGLGAMTSGALDPTDSNMAAPLLGPQLQRAAVRGHLGDRVHHRARHGERADPRLGRRRDARPAGKLRRGPPHRSRARPHRQDRVGRRRRRRDRARHPVQGAERQLPRRLGVQRRRQREPAGAGDAAVLAAARRGRASSPRSSSAWSARSPGSC